MSNQYNSRQERRKANHAGKPQKKKRKKLGFLKIIVLTVITLFVIGVATVGVIIAKAPDLDPKKLETPQSSQLLDKNNKQVSMFFSEQKRIKTSINDVPEIVQNAFIATEDIRFRKHHGIDVRRIFGAALANVKEGFGSEGASTITQQVIKRSYLTPQKTFTRKIQEAYLAIKLEQKYSKDQILEMYLNKVWFGNNSSGLATAAKTYFNKDVKDLNLSEGAILAALPKAPSYYDPFKHPEAAEQRRNVVLNQMAKYHFISKEQAEKAKAIPIKKELHRGKTTNSMQYAAYQAQVLQDLKKVVGDDVDPFTSGLKIYTNLDTKAQEITEKVLESNDPNIWTANSKNIEAGVAIIDPKTGAIRAIGSGREENQLSAHYASGIERQPGSTIKPILDYGPAIDNFQWSTGHILSDTPLTVNGHEFRNANRSYSGDVSMRYALEWSKNLPAIRAYQEVGPEKAKDFASKLGIKLDEISPAYAIGGFKTGLSPLQMAGAYSAFANSGVYNEPTTIRKVVFPDGNVVTPDNKPVAAMHDYTAYMITDMLKDVVQKGTGTLANVPDIHLAGKTGTTNFSDDFLQKYGLGDGSYANKDSWMVGYSPSYSTAVWAGYDNDVNKGQAQFLDSRSGQDGIPKRIFKEIMSQLDHSSEDFKKPNSVVEVPLEKGTEKRASEYTPEDKKTYELFVRGHEPTEVSTKYEKPAGIEGLTATYNKDKKQIEVKWNYNGKASYKLSGGIDGAPLTDQGTIKDKQFIVKNPTPGAKYTFQVVAVDEKTGKESEPAQTSITIPKDEDTQPDDNKNNNNNGDKQPGQGDQNGQNPPDQGGDNGQTPPDQGDQGGDHGGDNGDQGGDQGGGNDQNPDQPPGNGDQNGGDNGGASQPPAKGDHSGDKTKPGKGNGVDQLLP
ncbi:transglycosylase domain-containing protein [Fictibacillus gelatini]|uniref:transglycosylase domain-containing protein n=1 Tax=Fictibacillus gelatini TaxID=225985 RepID=UPI00041ADD73|nr:PBP1A family penicillin-binding protein [Fictibacillus gelatini]